MRALILTALLMFSMGVGANVTVEIEKFTGGTVVEKSQAENAADGTVTVTLTVTPDKGYTITQKDITVVATIAPSSSRGGSRRNAPEIGGTLELKGDDPKDLSQPREYTVTVDANLGVWVKEAKFKESGAKADRNSDDLSGVYYIASNGYNASSTSSNYYLCPTEGWCYYVYTDQDDFQSTDNGQPFLTTHKCRDGEYNVNEKAVWIVEKHPSQNYYYIKRAFDGKYIVFNGQIRTTTNPDRMRVHLEAMDTPNDNALFAITQNGTAYNIQAKADANAKYWTVNGGNKDPLTGQSGKTAGPTGYTNTAGIIGIYQDIDANSNFYLEQATIDPPTITNNYTATNTFTITAETGATIYYTTDGTTPTISTTNTTTSGTGTTPVNVTQTESLTVIKAIAKGADDAFPTIVTTYNLPQCAKPVISVSGGKVTITCATEGSTIHYTINGSPATSSSTVYTVPFAKGNDTTIRAIATKAGYVNSIEAQLLPPSVVHSSSAITDMGGNYILADDFTLSASVGSASVPFTGIIDGQLITRTFSYPLVAYADGATIKNVILDNVNITTDKGNDNGNTGAICNEATGATRIYNCGVLATEGSTISGSGHVGSIVGSISGNTRVINCYSFATVNGGTYTAGIVGYNPVVTTQANVETAGMVVNCMFYGEITGSNISPVYGGELIDNAGETGVNNYNYYRRNRYDRETDTYVDDVTFDNSLSLDDYHRSWPADAKYLTRFEYYRSILNSNKKLCTWWVNGTNGTAPSDADIEDVGIAKWVLDPSIAPYPILKKWGKYPSVINRDPNQRINPSTKAWVDRADASDHWGKDMAPDTEGQILGRVSVTINNGKSPSTSKDPVDYIITAMDTVHNDYCYGKIQLPYYNEIFGNPDGDTWEAKYGGNYTAQVVTGWDVSGGSAATDYNFADRDSYSGRVYAQGGYFYVPKGMTSITITAHWANAVYVCNKDYSIDRVNVAAGEKETNGSAAAKVAKYGSAFTPAGTIPTTFQGRTVYTTIQEAIGALTKTSKGKDVYNQAIVLIGNVQVRNHSYVVNLTGDNAKPFTLMSADLDFDNEPDNCLELQFRNDIDRPGVQPIRFDFLPVPELGLAIRTNKLAYAIGIMIPLGHFEITETAFMHTTQFEYDANVSRTGKSPVIINGGEHEMFTKRKQSGTATQIQRDRTSYFLLGGNAWVHRFAPGAHPNTGDKPDIYLFPVNVIGGQVKELYLTGLYRPELPKDGSVIGGAPRCYIDGGKFDIIAGAGYDKVSPGEDVTFIINHSLIGEFYGGGINATNPVSGNIDVTINNSQVDKYCGGPKVGVMADGKTVKTDAKGTTFGVFYGGGNGGNSYYRELQRDGDFASSNIGNWEKTPNNSTPHYNYDKFNPLNLFTIGKTTAVYNDSTDANKGYHAEYEFEVFNQSNGLSDEITQRGFIHWIQFGITTTGTVESTLENCKVLGNFYGGGNLASVSGDVTSTLTNTQVDGSVFGAGYSAAIPTFQVHDKDNKTPPSINDAGVITEGSIPNLDTVYEWTNNLAEGKTKAQMKANPTYSIVENGVTKNYCYTWNSLENLGTVTGNVSLTIDGVTVAGEDGKVMTVAKSVYGGGEESAVNGNTSVSVTGGAIGAEGNGGVEYGNVYGGGKGKDDDVLAGLVKGNTKVEISNGRIYHNVYGGGAYGSVGTYTYYSSSSAYTADYNKYKVGGSSPDPAKLAALIIRGDSITGYTSGGKTEVYITGGTFGWNGKENGMVFGSSRGNVGAPGSIEDRMAWVYDTHVAIGDTAENATITTDTPIIMGSVYGGGENGHNLRHSYVRINGGTIGIKSGVKVTDSAGKEYEGAAYPYRGNVYGGGCGTDKYYTNTENVSDPYDGNGNLYNPLAGIVQGNAFVNITAGDVARNVYGAGAMGSVGIANTDGTITNGLTTVTVSGGTIGVDGKNGDGNVFGAARGDLDATGDNLAQVRETNVSLSSGTVQSCIYGGGEAGIVKEDTEVTMSGGSVNLSVYGGGCLADVLGNTSVKMTDGYVFNGIFGGGYSGSVGTFTRSTAEADVKVFGHVPHDGCIGRPMSCAENTGLCKVFVTGGQVGPIEVATEGMTRRDVNGRYDPVEEGWIWGGGRGLVEDPTAHPDTHFTAYVDSTDVTIGGDAFILESIIGGGEFGRVLHGTHVTIQDQCQIGVGYQQMDGGKPKRYTDEQFVDPSTTPITNDNALAACSSFPYGYDSDGDGKPDQYLSFDQYYDKYYGSGVNVPDEFALGSTSLASDGKTWIGVVFGGGSGYMPCEKENGSGYEWVSSAGWVGGNTLLEITGGHILSNVYGANEYTNVEGKSTVKMSGGTIGVPRTLAQIKANPLNGNLFGAGKGDPRTHFNQMTNVASTAVEVTGGIIYGSVYGGGEDGHVIGNAVTTIKKVDGKDAPVIGCNKTLINNGNVFGGGQGSAIALTAGVVGGNITLNIEGGTVMGSVYGGGEIASVGTHFAMVKIEDPNNPSQMIDNPDYGLMQEEDGHGDINVNLKGGTIEQNVYGGCMGTTEDPALGISKNVVVELNKDVNDDAQGCAVKGMIFGCNNVNSSPEGTVTVHVYKTQRAGQTRINNTESVTTAKVDGTQTNGEFDLSSFDVQAVYGGGNLAAYVPKDLENGTTRVIIDGCDRTSIGQVYGGGNAASTPATDVLVNGTYEIGELFGGGNGKDAIDENTPNPGANVGFKDYHDVENDERWDTKEERQSNQTFIDTYTYGTGKANVYIKGGKIHRVFGGSNTKGNVRITALTMLEEFTENNEPVCRFQVDEAYGGGKSAPMDAEAKLLMACIPGLEEVYGGAQAADVYDDVTLTITNGTFDRVFGGNNISGTIRGKITVNIEETGCKPIIIGELYGGGNLAGYSVYGYNDDGTVKDSGDNPWDDPQINVKSFTSIGTVYGGGYGTGAVMVGNPHVNISESVGDPDIYPTTGDYDDTGFKGKTITVDGHDVVLPAHTKGKIGAINNVFGGGNAAQVIGDTHVNIGTLIGDDVYMEVVVKAGTALAEGFYTRSGETYTPATAGTTAVEGTTYYKKYPVVGVDIRGNVYGGGNAAEVTGNTNVNIGKKKE